MLGSQGYDQAHFRTGLSFPCDEILTPNYTVIYFVSHGAFASGLAGEGATDVLLHTAALY